MFGVGRLSYCAQQTRRLDREGYLCALFAPAASREALFALLAFNAEVARIGESVSEPLLGQMRLQWWRDSIDRIYAGVPSTHPVLEPLAEAIGAGDLPQAQFGSLLDAYARELEETPPATLAELDDHAYVGGGALSELLMRSLGIGDDLPILAVRHIGAARALLRIVRSSALPGSRQLVFFPEAMMREVGLDPAAQCKSFAWVVESICAQAAAHLATARSLRPAMPPAGRPVLLLARAADAGLAELDRARFDPFRLSPVARGRMRRVLWSALFGGY